MQEHKLTVRITEAEYRPIKIKAVTIGVPVSAVVRELLARWVAGELRTEAEAEKRST